VIPLLCVVTAAYIGGGFYVWATSPDWRPADTFSAFAGGAFFVISTLFALVLDERAKDAVHITTDLTRISINQTRMLRRLGLKLDVDLESAEDLPVALGSPLPESETVPYSETTPEPETVPQPETVPSETQGTGILARLASLTLGRADRRALEEAIQAGAAESVIRDRFARSVIFALGHQAPGPTGRLGEESDILHFTVDDLEGKEVVFMPVFTRFSAIIRAQQRNPEWKKLSRLIINGKELLPAVDPDVTLVINPWEGPLEYQLPPSPSSEEAPTIE
jgi:hypothetical protein